MVTCYFLNSSIREKVNGGFKDDFAWVDHSVNFRAETVIIYDPIE